MSKIAIVTDSSTNINQLEAQKLGIYVFPIPVTIDNVVYFDGATIEYDDFINRIKDGKISKTSQISYGDIESTYSLLLEKYDYVLHLPMTSKLSGIYQTAVSIAEKFKGRVIVFDMLKISALLKYDVLCAKKLVDEGKELDEILEVLKKRVNTDIAFIVPKDLNTLRAGGRINQATAVLGNLLGIKVIISVENGKLDKYGKERTIKKAFQTIVKGLKKVYNKSIHKIAILKTNETNELDYLIELVKKELDNPPIIFENLSVAITSHTGYGTFGIGTVTIF